ncbi:dihydroorotase, partial [Bacillus thuringiensis]|nr:dihydroorotase [Bacillus thuringiensis]
MTCKSGVIDVKGYLISPGVVAVDEHLLEPGGEHKDTIEECTLAAAKG